METKMPPHLFNSSAVLLTVLVKWKALSKPHQEKQFYCFCTMHSPCNSEIIKATHMQVPACIWGLCKHQPKFCFSLQGLMQLLALSAQISPVHDLVSHWIIVCLVKAERIPCAKPKKMLVLAPRIRLENFFPSLVCWNYSFLRRKTKSLGGESSIDDSQVPSTKLLKGRKDTVESW